MYASDAVQPLPKSFVTPIFQSAYEARGFWCFTSW
ncbi:hypothetical protein GO279_04949 [Ralstonia solanacearum]|nr:hypothetical protein [Ralstonia solanacearum]NKA86433.1 hypothetical protein [Ralstonia solanacearum]NKA91509.1 hypothetical protein [Ralstonia solanacearum]NKF72778.1 hypothetical protein [Ralstonia solanacearum]NKG08227.1 hypothetical protein [Ralstonia solanacearum]